MPPKKTCSLSEATKRDVEDCIRTLAIESLRREKQEGVEFPVHITPLVLQRLGYRPDNGERDIRDMFVEKVDYQVGPPRSNFGAKIVSRSFPQI